MNSSDTTNLPENCGKLLISRMPDDEGVAEEGQQDGQADAEQGQPEPTAAQEEDSAPAPAPGSGADTAAATGEQPPPTSSGDAKYDAV